MSKSRIVSKDNALIEASYTLGVVEQRLIFLAIIEAREKKTLIEAGGLLRINCNSYAKQFEVMKHTAYEAMKRAVNGLYEAGFSYTKIDDETGKVGHYKSRWVDKIGYIDELGCVELVFASDIIPLITRLEKRYTEYELKQVSRLQSEYAIRLYELMVQWRTVGKTPQISLDKLRSKLGLNDEYKAMCDFKKRVLNHGISQINEHTDITAKYQQHKSGRRITGFTFIFKLKPPAQNTQQDKRDPSTIDWINGIADNEIRGMSLAQAKKYASLLHRIPAIVGNWSDCKDYTQAKAKLTKQLQQPEYVREYMPYLIGCNDPFDPKTVGFK